MHFYETERISLSKRLEDRRTHTHPQSFRDPDAQATVSKHIKLLHKYNEIRDIGQGLMGLIADQRGVRIVDVYEEFGVAEGD